MRSTKQINPETKMTAGRKARAIGPNQYYDRNGNVRTVALRHRVQKES